MQSLKQHLTAFLILFFFLFLFSSFKVQGKRSSNTFIFFVAKGNNEIHITDSSSQVCDPEIWKHVYNPGRLKVIKNCITISGVITESRTEADGDHHLLLKPDKGQENLLTNKNLKNKKGNLVIEAICVNKISAKKVGNACNGYVNHITIPAVGAHVSVMGSLVLDTHNGWNEIHPISKIVLK